jgi:malate dehydrogenase (oxaloacetate-decarboxylating)(NADP+)
LAARKRLTAFKGEWNYTDIIFPRSEEENLDEELRKSALEYHRLPRPGKISILATKQLTNQRDLALAYSPGVALACEEIVRDPARPCTSPRAPT